jgi:hypothetical protein
MFGDQLEVLRKANPSKDELGVLCDINIAFYKEALALPLPLAARVIRWSFAGA